MNTEIAARGTKWQGLAMSTIGFFVGFAAVSLFGPTARFLQTEVGISAAVAGMLISIPSLTGSLLRIPFAAWADTEGGRTPFITLLVLSLAGIAGIAVIMFQPQKVIAGSVPLLLVLGALGGCGIATFSVGVAQTSYWFPKNQQGRANAIFGGLGNTAPGIYAVLLTSVAIPLFGLAGSYVWWAIFLFVGLVAYVVLARNAWYFQFRKAGLESTQARERAAAAGQELFPKGNLLESLAISGRKLNTWLLVLVYFASFGGFLGLTAWLPTFGSASLELPLALAGMLTGMYTVLASVIRVGSGPLTDKFGGVAVSLAGFAVALLGAVLTAIGLAPALSVTGLILMAAGMGVANAAVFKLVPQAVPEAVGGAAGWVGGLGAFGGFVLPLILSSIAEASPDRGYADGFWVFAGLFAVSIGLVLLIGKATRKEDNQ